MFNMENNYTETSTISYGQNLKNSFGGVVVGIILFFASFVLLWWNEGNSVRLIQSEDFIRKNAIEADSNMINRSNDTKLIATNGSVYTDETLSDSMVTMAKALKLNRTVEMYQWIEKQSSEEHKNFNGSTTKTTTYSYEKTWDQTEHNSDRFKRAEYHNPKFIYRSKNLSATSGMMGNFKINKKQILRISSYKNLEDLKPLKGFEIVDNYYYKGHDYSNPEIGDIRISYNYVPSGADISIIGQQNSDNTIGEIQTKKGPLYIQYDGILNLDNMLNKYKKSNTLLTYGLRLLGFMMMYIGLQMLVNPIVAIARIIPFLSEIIEFISSFILGTVALILSLLTIAIAWFMYRPIFAISLLILIGIMIYYIKQYVQKKKTINN